MLSISASWGIFRMRQTTIAGHATLGKTTCWCYSGVVNICVWSKAHIHWILIRNICANGGVQYIRRIGCILNKWNFLQGIILIAGGGKASLILIRSLVSHAVVQWLIIPVWRSIALIAACAKSDNIFKWLVCSQVKNTFITTRMSMSRAVFKIH